MKIGSFFAGFLTGLVILIAATILYFGNFFLSFFDIETGDKIDIFLALTTIILSVVSVVIAVRALNVSKQSMIEANRPYVIAYMNDLTSFKIDKYIIIKNFGKSGAFIYNIFINIDEEVMIKDEEGNIINGLEKSKEMFYLFIENNKSIFIAPNQSFKFCLTKLNIIGDITIEYHDMNGHNYREICRINSTNYVFHSQVSNTNMDDFQNKLLNAIHNSNRNTL